MISPIRVSLELGYIVMILTIISFFIDTISFIIKYQKKKKNSQDYKMAKLLAIFFSIFFLALVVTSISILIKREVIIINLKSGWLYNFITEYQLYKMLIAIANIFYYQFYRYVFIYNNEKKSLYYFQWIIISVIIIMSLIQTDITILINIILLFIQSIILYGFTAIHILTLIKRSNENNIEKQKYKMIAYQSIIMICVWLSITIDFIYNSIFGTVEEAFNITGLITYIIMIIFAIFSYMAYNNPKFINKIFKSKKIIFSKITK